MSFSEPDVCNPGAPLHSPEISIIEEIIRVAPEKQNDRIDTLIKQLNSESLDARGEAVRELIEIGAPAFPALRLALGSDIPRVRGNAASSLSYDPQSWDLIFEMALKDPDPKVRETARSALGLRVAAGLRKLSLGARTPEEISGPRGGFLVAPRMLDSYIDKASGPFNKLDSVFEEFGPNARQILPDLLNHKDPSIRLASVFFLSGDGLWAPSKFERLKELESIGVNLEQVSAQLLPLLADENEGVRLQAAKALNDYMEYWSQQNGNDPRLLKLKTNLETFSKTAPREALLAIAFAIDQVGDDRSRLVALAKDPGPENLFVQFERFTQMASIVRSARTDANGLARTAIPSFIEGLDSTDQQVIRNTLRGLYNVIANYGLTAEEAKGLMPKLRNIFEADDLETSYFAANLVTQFPRGMGTDLVPQIQRFNHDYVKRELFPNPESRYYSKLVDRYLDPFSQALAHLQESDKPQ